ncbi:MAG TPA: hypothetical protein VJN43_15070 [Bryobacteraceae bacterium]|nr:hypothetical protein [Bryobacteraceae bacterium]
MKKSALSFLIILPCLLAAPPQAPKLDTTTFVVVGDGLAAGMADFALRDVYQKNSFPALMAKQMKTAFPQPFIQPPGIGSVPGFPALPVAAPGPWQTSVRTPFPPPLFVFNLAVPGHHLEDAISLRPVPPLVQQGNWKQTATNLVLGYPAMILGPNKPLWSQMEYAIEMNPTLVLVELGYTEAIEAAAHADPTLIPDPAAFHTNYAKLLAALQSTYAQVVTTTIPDPVDTAYFSTAASVAHLTGTTAGALNSRYGLNSGDLLSPNAVFESALESTPLPPGSVTSAATAAEISKRVQALNSEITSVSKSAGAVVYDLHGLFSRLRSSGYAVGNLSLTSNYLGGLYSLSGFYPGWTVHALIANDILALLNQTYNTSFPLVNLSSVAPKDPAVRFRPYAVRETAQ